MVKNEKLKIGTGTGEMIQRLEALAVLPENQGLILSTQW